MTNKLAKGVSFFVNCFRFLFWSAILVFFVVMIAVFVGVLLICDWLKKRFQYINNFYRREDVVSENRKSSAVIVVVAIVASVVLIMSVLYISDYNEKSIDSAIKRHAAIKALNIVKTDCYYAVDYILQSPVALGVMRDDTESETVCWVLVKQDMVKKSDKSHETKAWIMALACNGKVDMFHLEPWYKLTGYEFDWNGEEGDEDVLKLRNMYFPHTSAEYVKRYRELK